MRLLSRLEAKQKSGTIRYLLFRQSPYSLCFAHWTKRLDASAGQLWPVCLSTGEREMPDKNRRDILRSGGMTTPLTGPMRSGQKWEAL